MAAIGAWTAEQFSDRQAERYLDLLVSRCEALAQGDVPHRSCRAHFADDLADDLRFIRAGQHFVIFVVTPTQIVIVDFLHQSADIARRLAPG